MNCSYCFLKKQSRSIQDSFCRWDDLLAFLNSAPTGDRLTVILASGELSLRPYLIETAYVNIKKLERIKDIEIEFGMYTNGTNMGPILDFLDKGILSIEHTSLSWDGIKNTKVRTPKDIIKYDDAYFNNMIKTIGSSKYKDNMVIRSALTLQMLKNIDDTLHHLYISGCRNWEYYYLIDNDEYRKNEFISLFTTALEIMYKYKDKGMNIFNLNLSDYYKSDNKCKKVWCNCLEDSIDISMDGKVLPCGSYSDIYRYETPEQDFDDISIPFNESRIALLNKRNCIDCNKCDFISCGNLHCVECSRMVEYRAGKSFQYKATQPCKLRDIERETYFRKVKK